MNSPMKLIINSRFLNESDITHLTKSGFDYAPITNTWVRIINTVDAKPILQELGRRGYTVEVM